MNDPYSKFDSYNRDQELKTGFLRKHSELFVRMSSLLDAIVIFASLVLTLRLYERAWVTQHFNLGLLAALLFLITGTFFALYRSWRVIRLRFEILKILFSWTISIVLLVFVLFVLDQHQFLTDIELLTWFFSAFLIMVVVRYFARMTTRYARAFGYDVRRVAFIGANETAVRMTRIYEAQPWMGMRSAGIFDSRISTQEDNRIAIEDMELAGNIEKLIQMSKDSAIDIVYICLPLAAEKRIKLLIDLFSDTTVSVYYCPNFFNFDLMQSRWDEVFGQPIISVIESPFVDHYRFLKKAEDFTILLLALPILVPLILIISLLIKLSSRGPVFFKQNRYGINGESFRMWKFRTMFVENCNETFSQVTKGDTRITPLGAFLRKTSLDEIPQFINVLLGDMSVVGPRPHPDIVNEDLRKRIHRYMLRHKIKPGITGLAQVNGLRGETETLEKMEQRIQTDLQYIRHWSLMLDLQIIFKTIFSLSGSKVY